MKSPAGRWARLSDQEQRGLPPVAEIDAPPGDHQALLAKSALVISVVALRMAFIPGNPIVVQGQGQRPATPVDIVNPLPVPVQGNVSITGNVGVSGGVAITNHPTVNVENWVPVEPYKTTGTITLPHQGNSFVGVEQVIFVPSGKRLVIEHVSASASNVQGGKVVRLRICARSGGFAQNLDWHYLSLSSPVLTVQKLGDGSDFPIEYLTASQPIRMYADGVTYPPDQYGGAQVIVGAIVFADVSIGYTEVLVTISGYLAVIP